MGFNSGFKGLNRHPFCPLRHSNPMRTAASIWPDCRLETNSLCLRQTVGGDTHSSRIGFSVAAHINSNVCDFYFLIWSLSRLLCYVVSGSNVAIALDRAATGTGTTLYQDSFFVPPQKNPVT